MTSPRLLTALLGCAFAAWPALETSRFVNADSWSQRVRFGARTSCSRWNMTAASFIGPNDLRQTRTAASISRDRARAPLIDGSADYIGKDGSVTKGASDLHTANGLVMSNDGKNPCLVETEDGRIVEFDVQGARCAGHDHRVDDDAKLLRTLWVPSLSMRNFVFGQVERCLTSWRWTRSTQPPGTAGSMRFRTPSDLYWARERKANVALCRVRKESIGGAIRAVRACRTSLVSRPSGRHRPSSCRR
jgi:hypothetical protein